MKITWLLTFYIFLLLLLEEQQVLSKTYTVENLIDDVSPWIPGSRFVLTTAYNLFSVYCELKGMYSSNLTQIERKLDLLDKKLDAVNDHVNEVSEKLNEVSKDVKEIKYIVTDKLVMELPLQNSLYAELKLFDQKINEIDRLYERFLEFNQTSYEIETKTYDEFVNNLLKESDGQLSSALNTIYDELVGKGVSAQILEILSMKHLTNTLVCRDGQSSLYKINYLYKAAMKAQMKGFILGQFAYTYRQQRENKPDGYAGELDLLVRRFYRKTSDIIAKIKSVMAQASQDYWNCEPIDLHEDVNYAKLGPIFQTYFLKEQDVKDNRLKCYGSCNDRTNEVVFDKCKSSFCQDQMGCPHQLVGCKKSKFYMNICLADPKSGRRYNYIEGRDEDEKDFTLFGKKSSCRKVVQANKSVYNALLTKIKCDYCQCTCVSNGDKFGYRYFSLRNVISDVENNKVVTGVRFVKSNNIFHIQIEQGVLLKNGQIDRRTVEWKPIDNFTLYDNNIQADVDYHDITWQQRTVHLDDLQAKGDTTLTGLKFKRVKNALQLEVQVTPFDFNTGVLDSSKSVWETNPNDKERSEIDMTERDLPQPRKYRHLDSEHNQFFKFTTSSFKDDVGQTVVPYVDLGAVTTELRMPLSGAGLIHQANSADDAGFLAFKLFNYNYAHHLEN